MGHAHSKLDNRPRSTGSRISRAVKAVRGIKAKVDTRRFSKKVGRPARSSIIEENKIVKSVTPKTFEKNFWVP